MSKWTRRGNGDKKERKRLVDIMVDLRTGRVSCTAVDVPVATHRRYIDLHYDLLPKGVEGWSVEQLQGKMEIARVSGANRDWERALLLLAHHRSEVACDLLREVEPWVPEELSGLHQLALGEAYGWLGYDYITDRAGRPHVLPAGAPWPEGPAS
jgi:hypothetical protein